MRQARREERDLQSRRRWFRFFRAITLIMLLSIALLGGIIAGLVASVARVLPSGEDLGDIGPSAPTRILASDGTLLGKVYSENREVISLSKMGQYLPSATLAIEDVRFMDHPGIDIRGILRAMVKDVIARNTKEGASTITQQLARRLYLNNDKKITRKLQEMVLALELERKYSKEEILETYLNEVYYGANRYGVQSYGVAMAARNYFGKDVEQLTLAQAAMLAGLPKNPRDYNPYRYPDAAQARRKLVLDNMRQYGKITDDAYQGAIDEPIKLAPEKKQENMTKFHAPFFVRYILKTELPKLFGQDTDELAYHHGVDIYTSLDPRMQKVAEDDVSSQVEKNYFRHIDDGALVAIDPKTGFIKAMVGGANFEKDQYNVVTQGHRQPGSSFKPFVYTTAFLHGYTPTTRISDRPGHYPSGTGGTWTPKNDDGRYLGKIPLEKALWLSRNAAAVNVAADVKINKIIDIAHSMGIKSHLEPVLPTAIGASAVSPLEMCSGYGTLADGGVNNPPTGIERVVTHDGDVLYEYSPNPQRAVPTDIANSMKIMMRGVIERGTGRPARCPFPASGKTGTTNSFRDAWFIGYTDDLVAAVWVGNLHNQPMNHTFGATVPAPIWHDFMIVAQPIMAAEHVKTKPALDKINDLPQLTDLDRSPTAYIIKIQGNKAATGEDENSSNQQTKALPPASSRDRYVVMLCKDSHLRATPWCPDAVAVTYTRGHPPYPPTKYCALHTGPEAVPDANSRGKSRHAQGKNGASERTVIVSICAQTGKIATDKCPIVYRRRFKPEDAPTETCPLHGG